MRPHRFAFLANAALLAGALPAQVLRVPSQHPTIAAALAIATSGTSVLVAAGTYNENLTWPAVDGIRLIGEEGAANTVIDGTLTGRVLAFGSGLTRATLVKGFTIRNGVLTGSSNRGAGININGSSPELRDNVITANVSDGTSWNYGGGIYVSGAGANPLIVHNEINGNELRNGSWNYGAGIHVAAGASADIIGNHVHHNANLTVSSPSTGRGHGAGIYVAGTALIASNAIRDNINMTSGWNYGGGIRISSSGTATILNNSIVANVVTGGYWRDGGGIHIDGSVDATMRGNIIADNTGHGIFIGSGTGGTISSDWECAWNNSAANYQGLPAGSNSIAVDPLFVSATDLHLQATSPCVDAMPPTWLTAAVATDADDDPRRVDGDLDGGVIDGARLDIGADEYNDVRLSITGLPQIGQSFGWMVASNQARPSFFAVSFDRGNAFFSPFGNMLLDPATAVLVTLFSAPGGFAFAIPNDPAARGVTIHGQNLVLAPSGPGAQFTNIASITAF